MAFSDEWVELVASRILPSMASDAEIRNYEMRAIVAKTRFAAKLHEYSKLPVRRELREHSELRGYFARPLDEPRIPVFDSENKSNTFAILHDAREKAYKRLVENPNDARGIGYDFRNTVYRAIKETRSGQKGVKERALAEAERGWDTLLQGFGPDRVIRQVHDKIFHWEYSGAPLTDLIPDENGSYRIFSDFAPLKDMGDALSSLYHEPWESFCRECEYDAAGNPGKYAGYYDEVLRSRMEHSVQEVADAADRPWMEGEILRRQQGSLHESTLSRWFKDTDRALSNNPTSTEVSEVFLPGNLVYENFVAKMRDSHTEAMRSLLHDALNNGSQAVALGHFASLPMSLAEKGRTAQQFHEFLVSRAFWSKKHLVDSGTPWANEIAKEKPDPAVLEVTARAALHMERDEDIPVLDTTPTREIPAYCPAPSLKDDSGRATQDYLFRTVRKIAEHTFWEERHWIGTAYEYTIRPR